jgi:hypothetical protein
MLGQLRILLCIYSEGMGYGLDVHTGVLRRSGPLRWFDIRGGYSFGKIGQIDCDRESALEAISDDCVYWYDSDTHELKNKDVYGKYRKLVLLSKVIKDLNSLVDKHNANQVNITDCIKVLKDELKKGHRYALLEGH